MSKATKAYVRVGRDVLWRCLGGVGVRTARSEGVYGRLIWRIFGFCDRI